MAFRIVEADKVRVVETKNGRWVATSDFNSRNEAMDYIQRCQMMDRDFRMEGR